MHPNPLHHPGFFSDYVPNWLKDLEMSNQPAGLRWMDAYKVPDSASTSFRQGSIEAKRGEIGW